MSDLEDRVAALEAALALFTRKLFERGDIAINDARAALGYPPFEPGESMTEEQVAGFRRQFDEMMREPSAYRILPSLPPLTPEQVRRLLRECVAVVKPGETLVIRDRNWTPHQVREVQDWMDAEHESGRIGFGVLAVIGEELGIAEPGGVPGAA